MSEIKMWQIMSEKLPLGLKALVFSLLTPITLTLQATREALRYDLTLRRQFRPRPDDIFIATYPKSGTSLMQMMLHQLTSNGDMDLPHILSVAPWFEAELGNSSFTAENFESLPSPRVFKTHLPYEVLPKHGKFIYIVRDVRDVTISAYHHSCLMTGRDQDLNKFVDNFLVRRSALSSWFHHLESWWPHRNDGNVLFLVYEDVTRDLESTVRKVSRFCGIPLQEEELPRIVERCGFAFMKQHDHKFDPRLRKMTRQRTEFIRQGKSGTGRHDLTAEQEELIRRLLNDTAARLGDTGGSHLFRE